MTKSFDELPLIIKILLALPVLDIVWVVYRLFKSIEKKNNVGIILAIVLIIIGIPFLWIIDIITIATSNKVLWID